MFCVSFSLRGRRVKILYGPKKLRGARGKETRDGESTTCPKGPPKRLRSSRGNKWPSLRSSRLLRRLQMAVLIGQESCQSFSRARISRSLYFLCACFAGYVSSSNNNNIIILRLRSSRPQVSTIDGGIELFPTADCHLSGYQDPPEDNEYSWRTRFAVFRVSSSHE